MSRHKHMLGCALGGLLALSAAAAAAAPASASRVDFVTVPTKAPSATNRTVKVWFRVPAGYGASRAGLYRALVLFGGRNTDGRADAGGRLGWGAWADREGVFIVCPGFRDDACWRPGAWSGKALADALEEIGKRHRVCTSKLLYYGYSAGSQCANLFPAWQPDRARAWVSHACGIFHEPVPRMAGVPGLVTCGDADVARYLVSRAFVENCRRKGLGVLWRSFPNHPHDVPPDSLKLARAFLSHYHGLYRQELSVAGWIPAAADAQKPPPFIGDDQDGVFYPAGDRRLSRVPAENRVALPSADVALAWGAAAGE